MAPHGARLKFEITIVILWIQSNFHIPCNFWVNGNYEQTQTLPAKTRWEFSNNVLNFQAFFNTFAKKHFQTPIPPPPIFNVVTKHVAMVGPSITTHLSPTNIELGGGGALEWRLSGWRHFYEIDVKYVHFSQEFWRAVSEFEVYPDIV